MKYHVTIESRANGLVAVITDTETNVEVIGKLQPYTRTKDGKVTQYLQIAFDNSKLGCENRGVVQVPKNENGKFEREFDTNLDNRRSTVRCDLESMFA